MLLHSLLGDLVIGVVTLGLNCQFTIYLIQALHFNSLQVKDTFLINHLNF